MSRQRSQGGEALVETAEHLAELARSSPKPAASFAKAVRILVRDAGPNAVRAIREALPAPPPAPRAAAASASGASVDTATLSGAPTRVDTRKTDKPRSPALGATAIRQKSRQRVLEEEALSSSEVSTLLGSESTNARQYAMELRKRGELLGVKVRSRHLYPAFQFDVAHRRVYEVVKEVSRILGADRDPWGVLSWWVSPNARIAGRRAPKELLADARKHRVLVELAKAVQEDSG
jgi:hypothetical protein